jgi:hypothetical protein
MGFSTERAWTGRFLSENQGVAALVAKAAKSASMCAKLQQLGQKNFFSEAPRVYNQDMYTRLVVVVNACTLLWTSRLTRKKSSVYGPDKPVHCRAKFLVANLNKIFACAKKPSFAQTIPVDIKLLIHR